MLQSGVATQRECTVPSLRSALANLRSPMPLGPKLKRVLTNTWRKVRSRSRCCGRLGEPGC